MSSMKECPIDRLPIDINHCVRTRALESIGEAIAIASGMNESIVLSALRDCTAGTSDAEAPPNLNSSPHTTPQPKEQTPEEKSQYYICPVCFGDYRGVSSVAFQQHVNYCLDRTDQPPQKREPHEKSKIIGGIERMTRLRKSGRTSRTVVSSTLRWKPSGEPKSCGHTCGLTYLELCCACSDKRPQDIQYKKYVDGVGEISHHNRSADYCPLCRT
eukprot:NODE_7217_length_799_cov_31.698225_g6609_i0.p1 GENE.NODE_7217_length_799_cov_31.698225_g6609_i0~~NODE_7217_length_799_cov_31.698225_g6609_i0.p1  ORF type:complete len:227 (+),score=37.52 NODE_7217_length_799_cov_31.698225_g6609_i0:37-681(+)